MCHPGQSSLTGVLENTKLCVHLTLCIMGCKNMVQAERALFVKKINKFGNHYFNPYFSFGCTCTGIHLNCTLVSHPSAFVANKLRLYYQENVMYLFTVNFYGITSLLYQYSRRMLTAI